VTEQRERVSGVQPGLTFVANEVVVLVMIGGAGSTSARGLRWPAHVLDGDDGSA
jgi:hypothetical protein